MENFDLNTYEAGVINIVVLTMFIGSFIGYALIKFIKLFNSNLSQDAENVILVIIYLFALAFFATTGINILDIVNILK